MDGQTSKSAWPNLIWLIVPSILTNLFLQRGKIDCRASSQVDIIQNYFLWKRMFRKQNVLKKGDFWYKNAIFSPFRSMLCPIWSTFSLIQCQITIFSPCWSNFSSHFLLLSPLPPIPDARMPQFVLPCPAVTGFKLQTMILDQKCKPSIHRNIKGSLPRQKTAFLGALPNKGRGREGRVNPKLIVTMKGVFFSGKAFLRKRLELVS